MSQVEQAVQSESVTTSVEAVVIRCGCGDPDSHNGSPRCRCGKAEWHMASGPEHICLAPRAVVDLGTVSQNSTDPDVQKAWDEHGKAEAEAKIAAVNEGVG